ncbi:MAG: hypothetical protein ABSC08_09725 [Bryobacteraceae bacterium]|jgi:hypothetical protein
MTGSHVASAARTRVAAHVHLLAILWFVIGSFWLVPAVIMAVLAAFITAPLVAEGVDKIALVLAPGVFVVLCVVFLASAVLRFVAGWGLLKMRPWGRTFALAMGFFSLIQPPFDTALGVYTLFVLLPDAAADEYRQMCQPPMLRATGAASATAG